MSNEENKTDFAAGDSTNIVKTSKKDEGQERPEDVVSVFGQMLNEATECKKTD